MVLKEELLTVLSALDIFFWKLIKSFLWITQNVQKQEPANLHFSFLSHAFVIIYYQTISVHAWRMLLFCCKQQCIHCTCNTSTCSNYSATFFVLIRHRTLQSWSNWKGMVYSVYRQGSWNHWETKGKKRKNIYFNWTLTVMWKFNGQMVEVVTSRSRTQGSSPGQGHCVMFFFGALPKNTTKCLCHGLKPATLSRDKCTNRKATVHPKTTGKCFLISFWFMFS